ncbi:MAG: ATP-dependent DNA helicase RecG [Pseudomonadota bacterium]
MNNRHPLATPVQYVKGVGPALAAKLERMGIFTVGELLSVIPHRYLDRRQIFKINQLSAGNDKTIVGEIVTSGIAFLGRKRKRIYEVIVKDETGTVSLKWFHFYERYYDQRFQVGQKLFISGEALDFQGQIQFIHPEVEHITNESEEIKAQIIPVYPLTEGLHQKTMRKIVRNAWDKFNTAVEPVFSEQLIERFELEDPWTCLQELHFPAPDADLCLLNEHTSRAHEVLKFDELFFLELGMALRRKKYITEDGISFPASQHLEERFFASLPFQLTAAQQRVIQEIKADQAAPRPMNRLLQGDVGSGKTVVALAAALAPIEAGFQVAIMAPTEILAEQHYETINKLLGEHSVIARNASDEAIQSGSPRRFAPRDDKIKHALLTSNIKGPARETIYQQVESGEINILVGTHALIQDSVNFKNLGFVVVDEQHRFGVMQRAAIVGKATNGQKPDVLIMTATPIPRTLALTLYGDLDVSVIDEMPKGRQPIITRLYQEVQREKLYQGMRHELKAGKQVYVVYPLIEESEKLDLKNATQMKEEIAKVFEPEFRVELLHGRMSGEQKENIMHQFKAGTIKVLVTTSVVEVGVDVPNASVMVIEHAERFGLSQLHQLRGRVGRSSYQSYCILMADYKQSEEARRRLAVMVETTDGFRIAEEDLALRGPGEFIGTKQSGLPPFRIANLAQDVRILSKAREAAFKIVEEDPRLEKPEHYKLKETLEVRWAGKLDLALVS